ncbi:uncharacterized protein V1510DRAFT_423497 [Dipodascopsis tothii]|uniref:uncharacterized protein n=1 Tax=Dipodascopsis tothii TaxID=44089 RepID=UPI0034CF349A
MSFYNSAAGEPQPIPVVADPLGCLTRSALSDASPGGLGGYSASAQLRFLATDADKFWQVHQSADENNGPAIARQPAGGLYETDPNSESRDSCDELTLAPALSPDDLALVYIHDVRPTDTLAGVSLAYGISADSLRKSNRMWAHDTIQSRPFLLLPTEYCEASYKLVQRAEPGSKPSAPAAAEYPLEGWAQVGSMSSVEVIRVPRQRLTHFPKRRRTAANSTSATPSLRASDDTPRSSMDSQASAFSIGSALYKVVRSFQKPPTYTVDDSIELTA